MKKVVIALLSLVVILIIALISIPTFFSDDIEALVKRELNRELDAKVEFTDLSLSALRAFPNLALAVDNLSIVNNTPGADTLAQLNRLDVTLGLSGLFGGKQDIHSVVLDRPKLTFIIDEDEKTNWEILPQTEAQSDTLSGEVNLVIKSYAIQDATIKYLNKPKNTELMINGLDHSGSGDFTSDNFLLNTVTTASGISYANEGVTYIQEAGLDAVIDLDMNLQEKRYTLKDNTLKLNEIELQLSGWVQEIADGYNTSLVFNAPEAKIEDVLSILPLFYTETYSDLNGSGLVVLKGNMNGEYRQGEIPQFTASASIKQGSFQYTSLPTPVEGIEMDLTIENKGNTPDDVLTRLERLNFRIKDKPFSARMVLTKPISDMQVDGAMKGALSMSDIRTALPLTDETQLSGDINADLKINGTLKELKEKQPQRSSSSGTVQLATLHDAA
ncbi:MAG: AsmA family protein, partial [Calditrichota bacterium]